MVRVDEFANGGFELRDTAVRPTTQLLVRQFGEPALDQVEPRAGLNVAISRPSRAAARSVRTFNWQAVRVRDRALQRAKHQRTRRENDLGRAFGVVEAGDGIGKLLRYQTKLERSFGRFWQMLLELQATHQHRNRRLDPIIDVDAGTDSNETVDQSSRREHGSASEHLLQKFAK